MKTLKNYLLTFQWSPCTLPNTHYTVTATSELDALDVGAKILESIRPYGNVPEVSIHARCVGVVNHE